MLPIPSFHISFLKSIFHILYRKQQTTILKLLPYNLSFKSFKLTIFINFLLNRFWDYWSWCSLFISFYPIFFIKGFWIFCSIMSFLELSCFICLPCIKLTLFCFNFCKSISNILSSYFDVSLS